MMQMVWAFLICALVSAYVSGLVSILYHQMRQSKEKTWSYFWWLLGQFWAWPVLFGLTVVGLILHERRTKRAKPNTVD